MLQYKLTLLFCIAFSIIAAKSQVITVGGKVVDATTQEPLPGATIRIENTTSGTTTDLNGSFQLKTKKSQPTLIISYVSYDQAIIKIDANTQDVQHLNIKLQPATTELEEVEVLGSAEGKVKAMLEQRTAENIKNVVAAEQIEQFPDMNAAEAVQRIPGITLQRDQGEGRYVQLRGTPPEYTNFSVNGEQIPSPEGDVRYVGLDIISADQIEFIEVTKVLTPDMDADGIGGNVNIQTKTAKEGDPEISASVAGGYNNLRETPNYQLQFAYGQRTGKFGIYLNGSYYQNQQGADNMEFKYRKDAFFGSASQEEGVNNYHIQYDDFQLRHYDITRQRTGLSATIDYKFPDRSMIYLRGMYNNFIDDETRRRVIYTLDDAVTETFYLYGGIDRDLKDRKKIQSIHSLNLGGEQNIYGSTLNYEVAYSIAEESTPDRLEIAFDNPGQAIFMEFDRTDPNWPRVTFPEPSNSGEVDNYEEYEFDEMLLENTMILDENISAKMDLKLPFDFGQGKGYLKFGGKMRMKEKIRDNKAQYFSRYFSEEVPGHTGTGPENLLPELNDGFSETDLLDKGYVVDHVPSPELTREFLEFYPQHFYLNKTETKTRTFAEDYEANENIYAGYGMFRYDFYRLMILGGARYEQTDIDYNGTNIITDRRGNFEDKEDTNVVRTYAFLLPQIQLKYTINNNFNIRAAATQSFSRPNFEDIIPYLHEERDEISLGNADLDFPHATNLDFLLEYYGRNGSLLSGGVFYKQIERFVYYYRIYGYREDPSTGASRLRIEVPLNGKRATVYGAELQNQFKLNNLPVSLPRIIGNLGLYMNYTYTFSEATINKRFPSNDHSYSFIIGEDLLSDLYSHQEEEKFSLPGQAEHAANLAVFFENDWLYIKLSANYHDAFLHTLGADPDLDEFYDEAWHFDFTANISATDQITVFTDIINLTNEPLKYYLGSPDRILQQEYYSWWGRIGLKFNF
ncbi:MAG: TonB-dependent receptor [Bacteroidetes bacterium]|jgi:TonB-dependent receptor|nr:TonB-dependent receptor [Bacteroidota bacterium]